MRNLNDFIRALGGIHNVLSGIAGKIDLIPVPGGGGGSSVDYSTDEHVVGKWTDGSDLYERVFETETRTPSNTASEFDISSYLTDCDNIFIHEAIFTTANNIIFPLCFAYSTSYMAVCYFNNTSKKIECACNGFGNYTVKFVVRYTKTS